VSRSSQFCAIWDRDIDVCHSAKQCVARLEMDPSVKDRLALSGVFFDANVHRDRKDRLFIEHAAGKYEKGHDRSDIDLNEPFLR